MIYIAYGVIYAFAFLLGICIGSFLNVVIYRVPLKINIAKGRSFCPACHNSLKAKDLVPIASFIFLKGRCRYCGEKISGRYPLVELLTGLLFVLSVVVCGMQWETLTVLITVCLLLVIAFVDLDTMEIPNGFILLLILPALLTLIPALAVNDASVIEKVIGFFAISVPMILMNLIIEGSFGGGDIKLMAVCGFLLGWQPVLLATFLALIMGGIYAVYLLATKKKTRKQHFAFGPFLTLGLMISLYFGQNLIEGYLSVFYL